MTELAGRLAGKKGLCMGLRFVDGSAVSDVCVCERGVMRG